MIAIFHHFLSQVLINQVVCAINTGYPSLNCEAKTTHKSSLETHKPNYILQMETEYDYLFKIVLIGDAGVGKTSIVRRYTDGIFTSAGIPTIGVDFCIKTLQIGSSAVKVGINRSGDNF